LDGWNVFRVGEEKAARARRDEGEQRKRTRKHLAARSSNERTDARVPSSSHDPT
jgi:hypothetical protein